MHRLRIKQIYIEDFFKKIVKLFEVLIIPVATESLVHLTPSQGKGKFQYPLERYLVLKVHAQLYFFSLISSIITTQLLPAGLKSELHLLPFSEIRKFYTLDLNIGG